MICAHRKNISATGGGGSQSKLSNTDKRTAGIPGESALPGIIPDGETVTPVCAPKCCAVDVWSTFTLVFHNVGYSDLYLSAPTHPPLKSRWCLFSFLLFFRISKNVTLRNVTLEPQHAFQLYVRLFWMSLAKKDVFFYLATYTLRFLQIL